MAREKQDILPPLTEAQAELLAILWERGESSVSEVWEELRRRRRVARNTVQTMLTRLAEKGWIRHRALGKMFLFEAAVPREEAQRFLAGRMVDSLFKGSTGNLVMTLLQDRGLNEAEAARIRAMLDAYEESGER